MRIIKVFLLCFFSSSLFSQDSKPSANHDFSLNVEAEYRFFFKEGLFDQQKQHFPSISLQPEYSIDWNDGYDEINFIGFGRWDVDDPRTHLDIRELYYQRARGNWELGIGIKKVFWGVTESNHLVDIINQTDQVESFDGEQKLGQPLLQFTYITESIGSFDFFYLPYHRKRTFSGSKGRLRFPVVIERNDLGYESSAEEWFPSFAFQWSHYLGDLDLGISQFYGNGREPLFAFDPSGEIDAFYPKIYQAGLTLQYTKNAFLWKLESIYRYAEIQDFFAATAGFEYTFGNVNGKGLDIGMIVEYLYDSRDELALTGLQNDIFYGFRFALNDVDDTSLLVGGISDVEEGSTILSIEGSRRIGASNKITLEARAFVNISSDELILSNFQDDSFIRFAWNRFF